MSAHDFSRLSPLDFEELIHDLLQAEWEKPLESFKTGADQGIDLRHAQAEGGTTIIQCKHYLKSGFNNLHSILKNDELKKIERLSPERYVLVTSVPLSPQQKKKILTDLAPFVKSPNDIIGNEGIEALLRAHPQVEKTHYKLWLTSVGVMERVLHAAEACKTEFRLEKIVEKLPIYVQSGAYRKALSILQDERIVIISGEPGIGKTTLAEMLIYSHLEDGFIPALIENEIREGRKVFHKSRRMVFYFDDFLGQTYLGDRPEYTGQNQDLALVEFIEMIRDSESRFILTTREHILSGALQRSERLTHSAFADHKCVLQLSDYSRIQKARILYNHIFFSRIPDNYKSAIIKDSFFLKIIDHRNFNPRIIDWITSAPRLKNVPAETYQKHIIDIMDDPTAIWRHAFENQISIAAKYILLAQYTIGPRASIHEIQQAWNGLFDFASRKYNFSRSANDFKNALKELTGSFITIDGRNITFLNPSVRDYIASTLSSSEDYVKDILGSISRIKQIQSLYDLSDSVNFNHIREWIIDEASTLARLILPLVNHKYYRWHRARDRESEIEYFELGIRQQINLIVDLTEHSKSHDLIRILEAAVDIAVNKWKDISFDVPDAMSFIYRITQSNWVMENGGEIIVARLEKLVLAAIPDCRSEDWLAILDSQAEGVLVSEHNRKIVSDGFQKYLEEGLDEERYDCSDAGDFASMIENLESLQARHDIDLTSAIEKLNDRLAERERDEEELERSGSTDVPTVQNAPTPPSATNDELQQMFMSLAPPRSLP